MSQICPSCHTEIVWDPEMGPEELCPHCFNALEDYRTVTFPLKNPGNRGEGEDTEFDAASDLDEIEGMDDWDDANEDLQGYEEAVTAFLDDQDGDILQCERCHEYMIYAGDQRISAEHFTPVLPKTVGKTFIRAPFQLKMYVCPACFQVQYQLSEEDRMTAVKQFLEK